MYVSRVVYRIFLYSNDPVFLSRKPNDNENEEPEWDRDKIDFFLCEFRIQNFTMHTLLFISNLIFISLQDFVDIIKKILTLVFYFLNIFKLILLLLEEYYLNIHNYEKMIIKILENVCKEKLFIIS